MRSGTRAVGEALRRHRRLRLLRCGAELVAVPHDADPWESLAVRSCTWHGTTVDLDLSGDEDGSADATLEHARTLLATWDDWEDRLRALLARKLLPLWLDWHADGP